MAFKDAFCLLGIHRIYFKQWLKFNPQPTTSARARNEASILKRLPQTKEARSTRNPQEVKEKDNGIRLQTYKKRY